MTRPKLVVVVDGVALPDEEARAFWERFSVWMEDHRGDLAGFADNEGFASVFPTVDEGRPVLMVSRTEAQRPYGSFAQPSGAVGGSRARHENPPADRSARRNSKK